MNRRASMTLAMVAAAGALTSAPVQSAPPAAAPWGGNSPPSASASKPILIIVKLGRSLASKLGRTKMTQVGSVGTVPGMQQAGVHMNNGGISGAMDDGDVGTDPQKTGGDGKMDDYTYSDGTQIRVPAGDTPPSDTSGFTTVDDGVAGTLGRAWAVICQAAGGCDPNSPVTTDRAVTGVRGEANPLDFGTSGGTPQNATGSRINLGYVGRNDGGRSDQGASAGVAVANASGQTLNLGNRAGGDAEHHAAPAEQLNANKLTNGAVDPKQDGPH